MAKHGANWYKRAPADYLGGVVGLTARQHAVYSVVLDLIYCHGGECKNDPSWIAGWIADMGPAAVRNTIGELISIGKLSTGGGILWNKRAQNEANTQEKLRENAGKTEVKRGKTEAFSDTESNEINDLTKWSKTPRAEQIREDKKEEGLVRNIFDSLGLRFPVSALNPWSDLPDHCDKWRTEFGLEDGEILRLIRERLAHGGKPRGPAFFDQMLHDHAMRKAGIKVPFRRMNA